ncbi:MULTISPECIES: hypothetical protein [Nitrosopumilus]|nr:MULTISPECIES: hypothetical protein [Nitrosopumilus]
MSDNQRVVKLPSQVILLVLKTEARMDEFLAKQAQKLEVEGLV